MDINFQTLRNLHMPNVVINEGTKTTSTPENAGGQLAVLSEGYGPKRVKTPNMEVEQFDPIAMQRASERLGSVYPTLGTMHVDIASPNHHIYQNPRRIR